MWLTDAQKIGVGLTSFGVFFMFLGVILFLDGGLLALGNILFVTGFTLIIGPTKTFYFFARKQKLRGSLCFFGGILLVLSRWPAIGILVEFFGFTNIFGDFFPVILSFLRQLPVVGKFLSLPYVRPVVDRIFGVASFYSATPQAPPTYRAPPRGPLTYPTSPQAPPTDPTPPI